MLRAGRIPRRSVLPHRYLGLLPTALAGTQGGYPPSGAAFLKELRPEEAPLELDEPVRHYLLQRDYPGNIRELKQVVARLSARHVGPGLITLGDIPDDDRPTEGLEPREWSDARLEQAIRQALAVGVGLKEIGRLATETAIRIALGEEGGNLQRAARRLGITDRALQMRQANQRLASISSISEQKLSLPQ
jgi:DNA-binding NtrC family response regulator